eukprot:TRINITY_DN31529_c0_g2_i5.p1 TRINITY_DN31529_c0_g2~~TRINITY_DN31529_c0_g2_i5.p1  ORF type:complete len:441 (-),score=79.07 TRINITY_DN31529_c0_g2_i5:105-1427(-)
MATQEFKMLINGELVGAEKTQGVINPATGEVFAQCPRCSTAQVDSAVAAAKAAFRTWRTMPQAERRKCTDKASAKVKAAMPRLREILVKEQGKPVAAASGELGAVVGFLSHCGTLEVKDEVIVDNVRERVIKKRVSLGVVGGICPWNFPVLMATWKLGETVMTGNTIVIKPSPYTPLATLAFGEVIADCFPPGVVNIVAGDNDVGQMIVDHPDVNKISFTGSTATGKKIQAACAATLKRVTLELGGNDAAIVLPEADPKAVAPMIFEKAMANTGQVCIAVKRCYVHESQHDELVKALADIANKKKVGDGFAEGVHYGPINNKMQFDKVCGLVEDARKNGATVHAGGEPLPGPGYFFPPTIVSGLSDGQRLVDEEQFGPVLPVVKYSSLDAVIEKANDTLYGLGGSVWGPEAKAQEVADKAFILRKILWPWSRNKNMYVSL